MPRYIIKLEGKYLEWSTIVDAPVTEPMTLLDFRDYYKMRNGTESMLMLEPRLERVEEKGTSCHYYDSAEATIAHNRAGEDESCLTLEQILDYYVRKKLPELPMGTFPWKGDLPAPEY